MRIVQLANFYGPRSGGLRTALHHLGAGYAARGHEVVLVVPGPRRSDELMPSGVRRITLPAAQIPCTGGYRAVDPWRVRVLLDGLRPDRIEVSDRLTLRGMGCWASRHGVPSVVISHERLDRLLHQFLLPDPAARRVADWANRRMAASYDTVVCTTGFARQEFDRIGSGNVVQVPLGVDLATFAPSHRDSALRAELARGADAMLVHCGRLSPEKHVERSVDTIAELHESGERVRLVIAGDGPRRAALQRRAAGLPVTFLGFVPGREDVAALLATADVSLAPGPHETFGLAALEALASGTPVVVSRSSALSEIVRPACGAAVADHAPAFANAVSRLLDAPEPSRRAAARARAEDFPWPAAVTGMLVALQVPPTRSRAALNDSQPGGGTSGAPPGGKRAPA
ncbi:MAG TPA: glycosyltransferase [Pseudonocardiaceae bacterium]